MLWNQRQGTERVPVCMSEWIVKIVLLSVCAVEYHTDVLLHQMTVLESNPGAGILSRAMLLAGAKRIVAVGSLEQGDTVAEDTVRY